MSRPRAALCLAAVLAAGALAACGGGESSGEAGNNPVSPDVTDRASGDAARQDAEAKSALRTAATAMHTWQADNGTFADATVDKLREFEPTIEEVGGGTLVIKNPNDTGYLVRVTSRSGNRFTLEERSGRVRRTCTSAGKAGCPGGGRW